MTLGDVELGSRDSLRFLDLAPIDVVVVTGRRTWEKRGHQLNKKIHLTFYENVLAIERVGKMNIVRTVKFGMPHTDTFRRVRETDFWPNRRCFRI